MDLKTVEKKLWKNLKRIIVKKREKNCEKIVESYNLVSSSLGGSILKIHSKMVD